MMLKEIMPGLGQLIDYKRENLGGDLSAGLIVAVMLIPQGMAYALLAGLDPVMGLYAVTLPLLVYALFASSRQLAVGPVAIVSLFVFTGVSSLAEPGTPQFHSYVLLLALLVGVIQLALGLLRLGFLVNFLSHAVISGFTSAAAIVIGLSQLNHLLGISLGNHRYTHQLLLETVAKLKEIEPFTLMIGLGSIFLMVAYKALSPRIPAPLIVVLLSSLIVYFFNLEEKGVAIVGVVPQEFPTFSLPAFNWESVQLLLPTAFTISLIGFVESIAIAKAVASKEKYRVNANQELRGLGLANIVASFFSAMPVTGGFSRTAVNYEAGAKTVLASVISAFLISITLLFLTPLFYYLPKAVLAAIILVAVTGLIDVAKAKHLYKVKRADGWTWLITFICTLFMGIEVGILVGIATSLLVLIWRSAYPPIAELGYLTNEGVFRNMLHYPEAQTFKEAVLIRVDAPLYFANLSVLENKLIGCLDAYPDLKWVIMDMSAVNDMDSAAIEALEELVVNFRERGVRMLFTNLKRPVREILQRAGWQEKMGDDLKYLSLHEVIRELKLEYKG